MNFIINSLFDKLLKLISDKFIFESWDFLIDFPGDELGLEIFDLFFLQ